MAEQRTAPILNDYLSRLYSGNMGSIDPNAPPVFRASDFQFSGTPGFTDASGNQIGAANPYWTTSVGGMDSNNFRFYGGSEQNTDPNKFALQFKSSGSGGNVYDYTLDPSGQYYVPSNGRAAYMGGNTQYGKDFWIPVISYLGAIGAGVSGVGAGGSAGGAGGSAPAGGGGFADWGLESSTAYPGGSSWELPGSFTNWGLEGSTNYPGSSSGAPTGAPVTTTPAAGNSTPTSSTGNSTPTGTNTGGSSTPSTGSSTKNPFVDSLMKMGMDESTARLLVGIAPTLLTGLGGGFSGKDNVTSTSTTRDPLVSQAQQDIAARVSTMLPEYTARDRARADQMMALANQAATARPVIGSTGIMGNYRPRGVFG